jgi:hypothetical protein
VAKRQRRRGWPVCAHYPAAGGAESASPGARAAQAKRRRKITPEGCAHTLCTVQIACGAGDWHCLGKANDGARDHAAAAPQSCRR